MLSGRGLCDGLITRPEESYRLWRVVVCDQETSKPRRLKSATGLWKIQPQWVVTPGKQTTIDTILLSVLKIIYQICRHETFNARPVWFNCYSYLLKRNNGAFKFILRQFLQSCYSESSKQKVNLYSSSHINLLPPFQRN